MARGLKIIRTTLNVEQNKHGDGWDVVIRLGSVEHEEDACDLATALVLQNGVSFEHNPESNKTLH
jgi:hypothetical protein|tara:strand:+ start:6634 stop:6828 length:195 start_codon:yes stop_codon:yes gene_type:complete